MSASQHHHNVGDGPHNNSEYLAVSWNTPAGKAHTIQAIPKALLMQFSPGIRQILTRNPKKCNVEALDFGTVALDPNAAGFVLGQLRWSMTTGTALNFSSRSANTLERRLQTYKALQVLDIYPFHKQLRKTLLNDVYRATPPSAAVMREVCTNHADDWGFSRSLLANVALLVANGSCPADVWDCFQHAIGNAQDGSLEQRFQAALLTVKDRKNRTERRVIGPQQSKSVLRLARKPSEGPSMVTETDDVQRFLSSERALFDDDDDE